MDIAAVEDAESRVSCKDGYGCDDENEYEFGYKARL